jgi:uncharacterized protein YdbL (DUF1318 family)
MIDSMFQFGVNEIKGSGVVGESMEGFLGKIKE